MVTFRSTGTAEQRSVKNCRAHEPRGANPPAARRAGPAGRGHLAAVAYFHPDEHDLIAVYSGDRNLVPSGSAAVHLVIDKAGTGTTLDMTPNPVVYGNDVRLVATVAVTAPGSGTPTGEVWFFDDTTLLGRARLAAEGTAALTVQLRGGSHSITARYAGDGDFTASTSQSTALVVQPAPRRLTAAPAISKNGCFVLSAMLVRSDTGAALPAQTVAFFAGTTAVCTATTDSTGVATCSAGSKSLQVLLAGGYTARFAGTPDYQPASDKAGIV